MGGPEQPDHSETSMDAHDPADRKKTISDLQNYAISLLARGI